MAETKVDVEGPKKTLREITEWIASGISTEDVSSTLSDFKESPEEICELLTSKVATVLQREIDTFWESMKIDNYLKMCPQELASKNMLLEYQTPKSKTDAIAVKFLKERHQIELEKIKTIEEQITQLKDNISESEAMLNAQMQRIKMQ